MTKHRIFAYLLLPLAVALAVLYYTAAQSEQGTKAQKTEPNKSAPGSETAERVEGSTGDPEEKTSQRSVKDKRNGTDADGASDMRAWEPPRFDEKQRERRRMVKKQILARTLGEEDKEYPEVLDAMRHVPRHLFVPKKRRDAAYADRPLPIGKGQTISQPYIVALMTAYLDLEKGYKVLEIGTGSGYQAAVLSEMTPHVYSIEILDNLAESARERLHELGYDVVKVKNADGYYGWEKHAPFDGIIVTCAAGHIPPPLLDQLKPGGRMIIPVGGPFKVQQLTLVNKNKDGETSTRSMMAVRFVPMKGRVQQ